MFSPTIPPTPAGTTASKKTIIITGGNIGLGLEVTRQFLVLGAARVILAVRSLSRGAEAISNLKRDPDVRAANPDAVIEAFELDLDDYASGKRFCAKVQQEVPELDVLVNNAGMVEMYYGTSKTGHERMVQVHCYTHLFITLSLLPLLKRTASLRQQPSHVTWVSSGLSKDHSFAKQSSVLMSGDDTSVLSFLDDKANFGRGRYADAKALCNIMVRRLASGSVTTDGEDKSGDVIINALCPGFLKPTGLDRGLPSLLALAVNGARRIMGRDTAAGARTVISAALVSGKETNGQFLQNGRVDLESVAWFDTPKGKAFSDKFWKEIVADVKKADPDLVITA